MVLGSAIAGKVQYVITGDKDLLSVGKFKDIKIVDPRTFWNVLKSRLIFLPFKLSPPFLKCPLIFQKAPCFVHSLYI